MRLPSFVAEQTLRTRVGNLRRRQHLAFPCKGLISPPMAPPTINLEALLLAIVNLFCCDSTQ